MDEPESADQREPESDADGRPADPAVGIGRRPRPTGNEAAMPQVQLALGLFILFLFLLVLWMVWPLLSHG